MSANKFQATMRSGPMPGKTFPIENEEASLGRDLANDIVISDPEVSRHHARFIKREESVFIEDLGSTNGTFLNGERIASPQQLRSGDVITFGESVVLVFEKITPTQDATVAAVPIEEPHETEFMPPPSQPHDVPEPYEPPAEPGVYHESDTMPPMPAGAPPEREMLKRERKAKSGGLPTWMIILIVAIVVIVCVIAVTLYFMPASWWCAITFDALPGCPLP